MSSLKSRWLEDSQFQLILKLILDSSVQPDGKSRRDWYATAPKAPHPVHGQLLDCREFVVEGRDINEAWLNNVLDGSSLIRCTFRDTEFQNASIANCDFTGSRFIVAQMSPIYAPKAIFKDCVFESCFLMGIGPRNFSKGAYSDLRECDFANVQASKTAFNRCDLSGARLNHARFVGCEFNEADLRGADFTGASFESCEFASTQLDDTPALRALIQTGGNLEIEEIQWG